MTSAATTLRQAARGPMDAIALLDAPEIDRPIVAGFDWGANAVDRQAAGVAG